MAITTSIFDRHYVRHFLFQLETVMKNDRTDPDQRPTVDAERWEPLESHDLEGVEEIRPCWRDTMSERDGWESSRARDHGHDGWGR
jgi:hypothetical protein